MKGNRLTLILLGGYILVAYLASYFICRTIYETREDILITYYNKSSIVGQMSFLMHAPLWRLDSMITGRCTEVGKWRGMRDEIAAREATALIWFAMATISGAAALFFSFRILRHT